MGAGGKYVGWWGNLGGESRGIITYGLAPNRQRVFAGAADGARHMLTKRIFGLGYVLAGLLPWYLAFQFTADAAIASTRKRNDDGYVRSRGY